MKQQALLPCIPPRTTLHTGHMWNETRLINFDVEIYPKLDPIYLLLFSSLTLGFTRRPILCYVRKSFFLFSIHTVYLHQLLHFHFLFFCCCLSCRGCFPKMEIKITSNLSTCSPHTKTVWSNLHVYLSQMSWYIKSSTKNMCVCVMKKVVVRENKQWQILKIKRENSGKLL